MVMGWPYDSFDCLLFPLCQPFPSSPSSGQVEDMLNETRYSNYVHTGQLETHIALPDFLKLFLNHRPVKGEDTAQLEKVFKVISKERMQDQHEVPDVNRNQLINFLKNNGEFFKDKDFHQHVKPLFSSGSGSVEKVEEEHNEFFHLPEELSYR